MWPENTVGSSITSLRLRPRRGRGRLENGPEPLGLCDRGQHLGDCRESARPEMPGSEWEMVLRIAASRGFQRSALLTKFLLFISQRALAGDSASINEQQIGVHVFARDEQFNRSDDNIVRTYARMLRKRIGDYFLHEGQQESMRVHIPRGGYVPVFGERPAAGDEAPDFGDTQHVPLSSIVLETPTAAAHMGRSQDTNNRFGFDRKSALLIAISLLLGFMLATVMPTPWIHRESQAEHLARVFWQTVFAKDQDTFIVPSDGGLVILHRFLEEPTNLTDYIGGAYRRPDVVEKGLVTLTGTSSTTLISVLSHKVEMLGERRYTSIVDLDLTSRISRRREVVPQRLLIRYARDLRMDDLKASNAILIGSPDSNPWVELFEAQLNFRFTDGGAFGSSAAIVNRQPHPGEQSRYASITGDPAQKTYGVVAYLPNLGGNGHVLLVEGINMAGTQAAGEFLFNPKCMEPVLERAIRSDGEVGSFEILLGTSSIAATSSQPMVLSERVSLP